MSRTNTSVATKIYISVFSLILFLGFLEIGLMAAGYFYSLNRDNVLLLGDHSVIKEEAGVNTGFPVKKKNYTILSLGDSYTFGGYLRLEDTYPYFLEQILTKKTSHEKYTVINGGVCDYNSRQVLLRLRSLLSRYQPDMVTLLVGVNDNFNLAGYNLFESSLKGALGSLRIYKMFQIIALNLKAKILYWKTRKTLAQNTIQFKNNQQIIFGIDGYAIRGRESRAIAYLEKMERIDALSEIQTPAEMAWYYFNRGERGEAIRVCEEALTHSPDSIELLCNLAHFYYYRTDDRHSAPPYYDEKNIQIAEAFYNRALHIDSKSEFILNHLSFFYNEIVQDYLARNRHEIAIELLFKAIELDPAYHEFYSLLLETYQFQSKYNADYIIHFLQKMLKNNPDLEENRLFMNYFLFLESRKEWEKKIDRWVEQNLNEIVKICKRENIQIVIQNYPDTCLTANRILRDVALKHSLPFVDNHRVFGRLAVSGDFKQYFDKEGDCNPEAHRLIAENIYYVMLSEGIIPE